MTLDFKENKVESQPAKQAGKKKVSFIASVKLTVITLSLIALTVLVGAWCPQETQVGREKVFETFGEKVAPYMIQYGVADIFHTPWFLFLIATLTLNMVACSFQRVFPKVRLLKQKMPFIEGSAIEKLPFSRKVDVPDANDELVDKVESFLSKNSYKVSREDNKLVAQSGLISRLAATVTHIGLLILVTGVTVTSWTGFNGFQPVKLGDSLTFENSQHSKLWIGELPKWKVRVDKTWKESHENGSPKQWFSELSVISADGKKLLKKGTISVNNPLTYENVDIYQASWGLDSVEMKFNGQVKELPLQQMGRRHAAFLPLDKDSVLVFSASDQSPDSPLRVFAKRTEWEAPRKLAEIKPGESTNMGGVQLTFSRLLPRTGLQYKKDPGIFIVFGSFIFIISGVLLAAIPFRQVWVCVSKDDKEEGDLKSNNNIILYIGGRSLKAKVAFEKSMDRFLKDDLGCSLNVANEGETVLSNSKNG